MNKNINKMLCNIFNWSIQVPLYQMVCWWLLTHLTTYLWTGHPWELFSTERGHYGNLVMVITNCIYQKTASYLLIKIWLSEWRQLSAVFVLYKRHPFLIQVLPSSALCHFHNYFQQFWQTCVRLDLAHWCEHLLNSVTIRK